MEIEGFNEIMSIVRIAKQLHGIGKSDIIEKCFFDVLDYDDYWHNMYGLMESLYSGYYSTYDEYDDEERMIFTDDVISEYYVMAWKYGKQHKIPHILNPYVKAAEKEARKHFSYCYSLAWQLCGHTKTESAARKSKLIIYSCPCDSCGLDQLAYSLLTMHSWFKSQCEKLTNNTGTEATVA